jgi:hypothetical protein
MYVGIVYENSTNLTIKTYEIANNRQIQWKINELSPVCSTSMYLALLETSGNQNFIFSTNKLSENIGASELTYRAGTQWVVEAVNKVNDIPTKPEVFSSSQNFRGWLLDAQRNRSISTPGVKIEIIIATSGKALFLAHDRKDAETVIRQVTHQALKEAPGLDICGIISNDFDFEINKLSEINKQLHQQFDSVHANQPGPNDRYLRLPLVDECATSGMPAVEVSSQDNKPISAVSQKKRNARDKGFDRISQLLKHKNADWKFVYDDLIFEESSNWRAIVHADGNGLGQIFLSFGKDLKNPDYIQKYRQFSTAIDICTETAFFDAVEAVFGHNLQGIPMRPLILGGDDLTVICAGESALQFTAKFLTSFEQHTSRSLDSIDPLFPAPGIILEQAKKHLPAARLSACAGIAIVKQHFPFSVAYHLAEDLIKSAKKIKDIVRDDLKQTIPCSAIDYHMLYDSSGVDLSEIRAKLEISNPSTRLYSRPYVVSNKEWYTDSTASDWIDRHHWDKLSARVKVLQGNEDEPPLPNSQMHDLREGLFLGQKGADARYKLVRSRYLDKHIDVLEGDKAQQSLFWQEDHTYMTGLLDAMDAASFWEKQS